MTILAPGTFKVSDHRKDLPEKVKRAVRKRYRYDHRPPLQDRPFDTERGDFIPPQFDTGCIDLIEEGQHDFRTFGRVPGAKKTSTTLGSDVHTRTHGRKVRDIEAMHQAKMAGKAGDDAAAAAHLSRVTLKKNRRPKRRIRSRGFVKGHRPLRSSSSFQRRTP